MEKLMNSLQKSGRSFSYAFKGIVFLALNENNFFLELVAAVIAVVLGLILGLDTTEWLIVIIMIGLVLMAEAFNSAIEKFLDVLHPDKHPAVGKAKDIAAGAVLIISAAAFVVGVIIYGSKIIQLVEQAL